MISVGNVLFRITFPNPTPKFDNHLHYETHDFAHNITVILDIPAMFVFCVGFDVINEMQMSFSTKTVFSYLPRDQPWKCVQGIWQILV